MLNKLRIRLLLLLALVVHPLALHAQVDEKLVQQFYHAIMEGNDAKSHKIYDKLLSKAGYIAGEQFVITDTALYGDISFRLIPIFASFGMTTDLYSSAYESVMYARTKAIQLERFEIGCDYLNYYLSSAEYAYWLDSLVCDVYPQDRILYYAYRIDLARALFREGEQEMGYNELMRAYRWYQSHHLEGHADCDKAEACLAAYYAFKGKSAAAEYMLSQVNDTTTPFYQLYKARVLAMTDRQRLSIDYYRQAVQTYRSRMAESARDANMYMEAATDLRDLYYNIGDLEPRNQLTIQMYEDSEPLPITFSNQAEVCFNAGIIYGLQRMPDQMEKAFSEAYSLYLTMSEDTIGYNQTAIAYYKQRVFECVYQMMSYYNTIGDVARTKEYLAILLDEQNFAYLSNGMQTFVLNMQSTMLMQEGQIEQGEEIAGQIKQSAAQSADTLQNIAEHISAIVSQIALAVQLGDVQHFKSLYNQMAQITAVIPDYYKQDFEPTMWMLKAQGAEMENHFDEAIYYYSLIVTNELQMPVQTSNLNNAYTGLARTYAAKGQSDSVIHYLQLHIERMEHQRQFSAKYATALKDLGVQYHYRGDEQKAMEYYDKALKVYQHHVKIENANYLAILESKAWGYYWLNKSDKAFAALTQDFRVRKDNIRSMFTFLSSAQRETYLNALSNTFTSTYPTMAVQFSGDNHAFADLLYDSELFFKGLLLSSGLAVQRAIMQSGDSALIQLYADYNAVRERIEYLQTLPYHEQDSLLLLTDSAARLDKMLVKQSKSYREQQSDITWTDIQSRLNDNECAIEFVAGVRSYDAEPILIALLVQKGWKHPILFELGDYNRLAHLVDDPINAYATDQLYRILWSNIKYFVYPGQTIYYAPSGILHQINLDAVPVNDTLTMGETYNMVRLSSTRELLNSTNTRTANGTAVLYGGLRYDMDTLAMAAISTQYEHHRGLNDEMEAELDTIRAGVKPLPGTLREVNDIYHILSDHQHVDLYTDISGSEESFKALSGTSPAALHIATHGFYFTNERAHRRGLFVQNDYIDPLRRSGLLLSGANIAYTGHRSDLPKGIEDGILTAKEVSLIDLRGLDLVVLSACQTARGDITGEGVFGLQRGFKQAGAQTIVMSLWKVDDTATAYLMTQFYTALTDGQSKRQAFRTAVARTRARFPSPYYWAAFVMMD